MMKMSGKMMIVATAAVAAAAWAQLVQPYGQYTSAPMDWFLADGGHSAAHGSLFDAGLSCGTAGTVLADQLALAECEPRLATFGVDNSTSNIVTLSETEALGRWSDYDRRPLAVYAEYVGLDAGAEVPISSVSSCVFWRAVGDGDAGAPWFAKTAAVLSTLSTCGARCTGFFSATPFQPGYYCFVPSGGNANVGKIWMRLNRMYQPRALPR